MKTHEEFARFVRMLTPGDQRVFRALASGRGIKDAASRTQKSEDYVWKLLEHPPFRDAVRWGTGFPYRRDAALRGDPIVDLEVLQADRPSAEAGLIPERGRARPATASQRRTPASSLTHGPAADTNREHSPSGEGSSDGSPAGSGTPSAESRPPGETVAVLLSGPSQPPSDTVGIVYAGPGSSDLDAVPPERDSDPDPIAAATEGPEGGCPEIAAEPPKWRTGRHHPQSGIRRARCQEVALGLVRLRSPD